MGNRSQSFNIALKLITTQFNKGIKNVQKQLRSFGSFVKGAFSVATITMFGRKMVQVGAEFENAMARVQAVTNATRREFSMMQKEAQRLGETTKYTATQAANALETLTRNGLSAADATRALSGVLELAQANSIELAQAADIITNSLNMFGLAVSETSRVNDVLSATASNSATDISLLYEALVNAAPAAKVLGFSIEETSAAIGALANRGVKGANAGTALRMALTKMADPKIVNKMNEMGVAVDETTMKEEGLLGTIKRLKDAQLSLTDLVAIFSQRGAVGVQQIIDAYEDFDLMLEITKNSAGTTARMFQQGVGSVQKEVDTLKSKYEGLLISISQKTNGAVRGAVKLLQGLIDNFKSIGGTIMNLASVIVPLLAKNINNLVKTTKAGLKAIKTEAAGVAVALGNWIGIIATLVTWIGTYLFQAWNKVYGEVKRANKEFNSSTSEFIRMRTYANNLIEKLGPDTDKTTLAGVVSELVELFPDFKDEIHKAAAEAMTASTGSGGMAKLKNVLSEIIDLQAAVIEQQGKAALANAYGVALGNEMFKGTGSPNPLEYSTEKNIREQLGKNPLYKTDALQKEFFQNILGPFITNPDLDTAISLIKSQLHTAVVEIGDTAVEEMVKYWRNTANGKGAIQAGQDVQNAKAQLDEHAQKVKEQEEEEAKNLAAAEEAAAKAAEIKAQKDKHAQSVEDVKNDLEKEQNNIIDDLTHGFTTNEEALKDLTKAYKKAYEDLRDLTGKTGPDNDYFTKYSGLQSGNMGLREGLGKEMSGSKLDKIDSSKILPKTIPNPTNNSIAARPTNPDNGSSFNFEETIENIENITNGLNNINSVVQNIGSAWNVLNDEESTFLEKLGAGIQLLSAIPPILKLINTLTGIGTTLTEAQTTAEGANASAKTVSAIAGLFSGNAEIPIAGIAIAAAGVAALIAALAAAPKFAQGGIVGGNSYSGDKNFARVNSGEMILNGSQQANLMRLINGGVSGGTTHDVNFVIRGKDLYGALKNYNDSASKIRSNI